MQVVIDVQTIEDLNDANNLIQHILARRGIDGRVPVGAVPSVPAMSSAAVAPSVAAAPPVSVPPSVAAGEAEVVLDKEGLPWDGRIHSSSKKVTDKGIWARRKGLSDPQFNSIKAELLARSGAAGAAVNTTAAPPAVPTSNVPVAPMPSMPPVAAPAAPLMPGQQAFAGGPVSNPPVVQMPQIANPNGFAPPPAAATAAMPANVPVAPMPAMPPAAAPAAPAPAGYQGGHIPVCVPSAQLGRPVDWVDVNQAMTQKSLDGKLTQQMMEQLANHYSVSPFGMLVTRPDTWVAVYDWIVALP